jgi:hypothetical protein
MRGALTALIVLAGVTTGSTTAHAISPSFQLVAKECDGTDESRTGTGFVVASGQIHGTSGPFLVTALHVIHGCNRITLTRIDCSQDPPRETVTTLGGTTGVQSFPSLDVAIIPFAFDGQLSRLPDRARKPRSLTELSVPGASMFNMCMAGVAWYTGGPLVREQFGFLATTHNKHKKRTEPAWRADEIRGSLDPRAQMYTYFGSPAGGSSGAPVYDNDEIIGIHEGGFDRYPSGWALGLWEPLLRNTDSVAHTLKNWGDVDFTPPLLQQADALASAADVGALVAAESLTRVELEFRPNLALGTARPQDEARVDVAVRLSRDQDGDGVVALGWDLGTFVAVGQHAQQLLGPDGEVLDDAPHLSVGLAFEPGVHLATRRLRHIGFAAAIRAHLGAARYRNVLEQEPAWGAIAGGTFAIRVMRARPRACGTRISRWRCGRAYIGVDLNLSWQPGPREYRYTGVGAEAEISPNARVGGIGLELGYAW